MRMSSLPAFVSAALVAGALVWPTQPVAQQTPAQAPPTDKKKVEVEEPRDPAPALPADMLKNTGIIEKGEKLWQDQCTHCHGAKAYPGKAPKLTPRTYQPDFVWDRIHNGFRGMPPWKYSYKPEEIVALVAYVMSDEFFP